MSDDTERLIAGWLATRSAGTQRPEGDRLTIGRSPDCDICVDDQYASPRHAIVTGQHRPTVDRGLRHNERHVGEPSTGVRSDAGTKVSVLQ